MRMKLYLSILLAFVMLLASCGQADTQTGEGTTEMITSEPMTEDAADYSYTYLDVFDGLMLHGRTLPHEKGKLGLEWSWSGFTMQGWFDGPILAQIEVVGQLGVIFRVEIDGGDSVAKQFPLGEQSVVLAEVEQGYHTITVRKVTEGSTSRVTVKALIFNGKLDQVPEESPLRIEFIGDSITNGVGSYPEAVTNWDYLTHCDAAYSYATMVGKALNAEVHLTSISGWGVVRGATSLDHQLPLVYDLASHEVDKEAKWDFASWQPDVVVVALGTNDEGVPPGQFMPAALKFLKTVRQKNPDAYIVWMYGMMSTKQTAAIELAITEMKDDRIVYLPQETNTAGGWGHPTYEAQCGYAAKLIELLKPIVSK
ncbi:MAG: hypothetical protein E7618_04400 [Ruminococcaceae bacterium]|nr:hypothetical protein [Oscillospiraceae bacterium]